MFRASGRRRISTIDLKELCHVFRVHFVDNTTVEPPHNGHLGDRIKWPLLRGLNKSQCMECPQKKVAFVERWPLVKVRL